MGLTKGKPTETGLLEGDTLPEEVLLQIFLATDFSTLLRCRLVCSRWNRVVTDPLFWRDKCFRDRRFLPDMPVEQLTGIRFKVLARMYLKQPRFNTNLIVNPFAKDRLNGWKILSSGGNGWLCEASPNGSDPVPEEASLGQSYGSEIGCFATSYHSCSKEQLIDLIKEGFSSDIIDALPVDVIITDWFAGRFDCGCVYELKLDLLDADKKILDTYSFRETIVQWQGRDWHKVEHRFTQISKKVRYIRFFHGGTDTQFWAGHYGSKITGSSVRIVPHKPA